MGKRAGTPDVENLVRMSRLFGVTVDALLTDDADASAFVGGRETARLVGRGEILTYLAACRKNAVWRAVGVFLCVLAPVFLRAFGGIAGLTDRVSDTVAVGIGLCLFTVTAAAAVAVFFECGARLRPFSYLENESVTLENSAVELLRSEREAFARAGDRCDTLGATLTVLSMLPIFLTVLLSGSDFSILLSVCATFLIVGFSGGLLAFSAAREEGVERALRVGDYTEEGRARSLPSRRVLCSVQRKRSG